MGWCVNLHGTRHSQGEALVSSVLKPDIVARAGPSTDFIWKRRGALPKQSDMML